MYQNNTENGAGNVYFGSEMIYIGSTLQEACDYFLSVHPYLIDDDGEDEGAMDKYNSLTPEEKQHFSLDVFTVSCDRYGHEIHSFPLASLSGLNRITDPYVKKIKELEHSVKLESLRRVVSVLREDIVPIPDEILDHCIKLHM